MPGLDIVCILLILRTRSVHNLLTIFAMCRCRWFVFFTYCAAWPAVSIKGNQDTVVTSVTPTHPSPIQATYLLAFASHGITGIPNNIHVVIYFENNAATQWAEYHLWGILQLCTSHTLSSVWVNIWLRLQVYNVYCDQEFDQVAQTTLYHIKGLSSVCGMYLEIFDCI